MLIRTSLIRGARVLAAVSLAALAAVAGRPAAADSQYLDTPFSDSPTEPVLLPAVRPAEPDEADVTALPKTAQEPDAPQDDGEFSEAPYIESDAPYIESDAPCESCAPCECAAASAAAAMAHKGVFYDNDFSYLLAPGASDALLGDCLKRRCCGDWITWDIGGQLRVRQQSENNIRPLGLTGVDDDFLLYRTRLYANVQIGDSLRFYGEAIDSLSTYERIPPRGIGENRTDLLNLFGDVKLADTGGGQLWARAGRQELLYGAERIISPLDWANTRRKFEGAKMFWKGQDWSVDGFWTRPMRLHRTSLDSPDYDREFLGLWATYHKDKARLLDLYYLRLENELVDFLYHTVGGRLFGGQGPWLWEIQGAAQFGHFQQFNHTAGFWTVGLGRKLEGLPWSPVLWAYYDWASGSDELNNGYHHLFPLAHKYLGFMDLFGRRNIETPNVQLVMSPCEKVKLLLWYYVFFLENQNDVPYSVLMTPYNPNDAPASAYLGQELDCVASWQMSARLNLLFGYSHFFTGDYFKKTPNVPFRGDANFYYTQMVLNF